jgi:hypothetical protein
LGVDDVVSQRYYVVQERKKRDAEMVELVFDEYDVWMVLFCFITDRSSKHVHRCHLYLLLSTTNETSWETKRRKAPYSFRKELNQSFEQQKIRQVKANS